MKRLTLALLLLAACATPRPSALVTPSGTISVGSEAGATETEQEPRTGAPPTPDGSHLSRGVAILGPSASPSPRPSGGLGDATSYFKPTPKPPKPHGNAGWASFYDDGPGIYVALPGWTRDSSIRAVVVCANVGLWRCATANVWTSCGCHTDTDHPKVADLSPDLMALITGWDRPTMTLRGVVRVTLQVLGGN